MLHIVTIVVVVVVVKDCNLGNSSREWLRFPQYFYLSAAAAAAAAAALLLSWTTSKGFVVNSTNSEHQHFVNETLPLLLLLSA
jgi:hypothetical protein